MTVNLHANFYEKLKEAEALSKTNLTESILILESFRGHRNFLPWGGIALANFYFAKEFKSEALMLNDAVFEFDPDFIPGWSQRIKFTRGTVKFKEVLSQIYLRLQKLDGNVVLSNLFLNDYLTILLYVAPEDLDRYIAIGMSSGIFNFQIEKGLRILIPFAREVRKHFDRSLFVNSNCWCLGFIGGQDSLGLVDDVLFVNMSCLKLDGIEGWEKTLSKPFAIVLCTLMVDYCYLVDNGNLSLPAVSECDKYNVIFWRLILSEVMLIVGDNFKHRPLKSPNFSDGSLWVRVGNVELWAIWSYLNSPTALSPILYDVVDHLDASIVNNSAPVLGSEWWPKTEAKENLTRLSLNAGWYARKNHINDSFNDWAWRYLDAMCYANILDTHTHEILRLAALVPGIRRQTHGLRDQLFLPNLYGKKVVFVTAFSDQIQSHYDHGNIDLLWKDLGLDGVMASLKTIPSPMSIWPYQPNLNWSETFAILLESTVKEIRASNATIFLASCGAYGLPLVHAINKIFGITCVYIGHRMNIYFGIITNAFLTDSFYLKRPDSKYWLATDLSQKYSEVSRIDDGRYVVANK